LVSGAIGLRLASPKSYCRANILARGAAFVNQQRIMASF